MSPYWLPFLTSTAVDSTSLKVCEQAINTSNWSPLEYSDENPRGECKARHEA